MAQDKKKLTTREKRFVDEMAKPTKKSNADAARKAGYSPKNAHTIAAQNLAKLSIQTAIENRRKEIIQYHGLSPEEVFGQVIRQMHSSLDDILDENGNISIEKARETGAIHLLKEFTQKDTPNGKQITVKMYPADEARNEIAAYLGLKQQDRRNENDLPTEARAKIFYDSLVNDEVPPDKAIYYTRKEFNLPEFTVKEDFIN